MDNTTLPVKIYTPWGTAATPGYLTQVPQTTAIPGAASWTVGFGPETFIAPSSGGTPPLGDYFNGALNQISDGMRFLTAGGVFQYDATFQANIGGYMQNALVLMASGLGLWRSTVNNNIVNPETGTPTAPATGWAVLTPNTYPWSQITGAPSFVLNSAFTGSNQSLVTNGYQKFPGGLIMQWGKHTSTTDNEIVTFPISFSNSCFNVSMTLNEANSSSNVNIGAINLTLTGFTAHAQAQERPFFWSAIGN